MEIFDIGDVVDDRYELLDEIGAGAHGTVFRARDLRGGDAEVALKCLHPELAANDALKARLTREARSMSALSGTSAAEVLAFGSTPKGTLYLALELLHGHDLEATLTALEARGERLPVDRLLALFAPIVTTLAAAHARGIIHRDLKPANIFVLDEPHENLGRGPVRLLDFGLAKDLAADPLTTKGAIAGSPAYIAPEVWMGKPHELDHRLDVYSLGAVIFRALAGRPPFQADTRIDLVIACMHGPRPSLRTHRPDLPEGVNAWVERALATSRDARFQDVGALWQALLDVLRT
ncbi:serine/threonine-protein kinase [Chondromyces apiculatus]|uniref:Serine/threonine protein kinase n=1 Tax=Chondromyces apiculatus DSM 436 TaxID=1192034 RepID=A0A017TCA5_9BACT|nr:serine/threonine-protein kinase [Chondromyces apiculatus]EYF06884.1 serine/threonine protein kinase [Chondromyces apiculatus DSM 436]